MKVFNSILKVIFCLLLVSPILGALGIFPAPTADLYNTPQAFAFIEMLYNNGYLMYMISIVFAIALVLIVMNQMAIAAPLILPIVVNIIAFHAFLDGGLLTMGALMANVLFLLNIYFLWQNREKYRALWNRKVVV